MKLFQWKSRRKADKEPKARKPRANKARKPQANKER